MFEAVFIEGAFCSFFDVWPRTGLLDADVFRGGDPKDLGEILQSFAERLARRTEFIEFVPDEMRNGGAKPRLDGAIASLAQQGEELKDRQRREPEDYHWEIIGSLVLCIAALLDHMEGKVAPP